MPKLKWLEDKDTHIEKTGPKEILWFIALWALGVISVMGLGMVIKLILRP